MRNDLIVALVGFYLLSETINKPIDVLHRPVPYFNEKLLMSVERTLKRFRPDQPFERSSWMIVDDQNLFWREHPAGSLSLVPCPMTYLRSRHRPHRLGAP